ncbi:MAG: hypothetical protein LQ349_000464 [Xanthoria aureola]|nr:MAG: hypothetical protein LQ349_000464 [Xanthoria aureola]
MTRKIDKDGLKKAVAPHGRTGASSSNGCPTLTNADAVTPPTKPDVHKEETNQAAGKDHRLVFEVYADGEGCLKLATTSIMKDGEKVIINAVAPMVQKHNRKYLGPRLKILHARHKNSSNRKQHDFAEGSTSEDRSNTPDSESEEDHPIEHSDHEEDDDGEALLEIESEQFDTVTAGDVAALEDYYCRGVCQVGQLIMRKVLKCWVKVKQPKKQSTYPYNGRKSREDQALEKKKYGKVDPNPGQLTAPPWWPSQDGWPVKGCRHKEPDHLKKPERTILALTLLSLTGCDETFTVERLFDSTKGIKMSFDQGQMLKQLYEVRKKQQQFQLGEIDASTMIPVYRPKGQPSHKKRRVNSNRKRSARKVRQERRDTSEAVEQSTQGTPVSMSESTQSFGSPITSLSTAKIEAQRPTVEYEDYVQPQYTPRNDDVHFDGMMPNPGVSYSTMYPSSHPFRFDMSSLIPEIPPYTGQTSPMASTRGRMPFRGGKPYCRRPTSVCKQTSPSYRDGAISREVGWLINDDSVYGLRPPLVSSGYPITGLSIPLDDPRNHRHGGLPPDEQQRICLRHNCTNYRTQEQHQEGVLRNGWLSFDDDQGGMPRSDGQQVRFSNDHQGGMPLSHALDSDAMGKLMSHEDLTPDSSLARSFGQQ